MTIKNIIYSTHQRLEQVTNIPVKRSHLYELLASAFGFNTYAALTSKAMLIQSLNPMHKNVVDLEKVHQRSEELGYADALSIELPVIIHEEKLSTLNFSDLIANLKGNDDLTESNWEQDELDLLVSPEVLRALEDVAQLGNPLANYVLALYYENSAENEENGVGSDYWYNQMQSGQELSGAAKEWAMTYKQQLTSEKKYQYHLREAARLGCDLALLDLADKFDDHAFFDGNHRDVDADPMRVAEISESLGRLDDHRQWLTIAAEAGNIQAMRELIETYDKDDLPRSWTWIYFSQLLGEDLTIDRHYAINEDGSEYDDDVGGSAFVGGVDGIELPSLEADQDHLAKSNAEILYNRMKMANKQS